MEWIHHGGCFHSAVGGVDRSTLRRFHSRQKQQDSRRLAATSKNPRNLFGLEASKIAHILRRQSLRGSTSRHFRIYQNVRRTRESVAGQRKYAFRLFESLISRRLDQPFLVHE